jgi:hypothetical protein
MTEERGLTAQVETDVYKNLLKTMFMSLFRPRTLGETSVIWWKTSILLDVSSERRLMSVE